MSFGKNRSLHLTAGVILLCLFLPLASGCANSKLRRTAVNPWDWGLQFGMNQGEIIEGGKRTLILSGQTAIDGEMNVKHAGDLRAQWNLAFENLNAVLAEAGMDLSNVVRVIIYTTDVEQTLANWDVYISHVDAAGVKPSQSLIGVAALALPGLMIEMEATAMD